MATVEAREINDAIKKLKSAELYEIEYALRILINYAVESPYQVAIRNLGGIPAIIPLLGHVNQIIQMLAAWALSNLALDDANRIAILKGDVVKSMIPVLASATNGDVLTKYLWLLTNLANNEPNRKFLSVWGITKILANLLKFQSDNVLIEVTKPLRNMLIELESQKAFAQSGGIINLISLLTSPNQTLLCELIEVVLTLCVGTDIMRKLVVAAGILPPIVFQLSSRNDNSILQSLKALITLSLTEENEIKIMNAGAVLPIVDLFCSRKGGIQNEAALLLSNLSCNEKIRENLRQSGIVNALVEALTSSSLQIQEQAARLITNMSMDDYNRMELVDAGALPPLEKLIQSKEETIREVAGFAINNLRVPIPESVRNPAPVMYDIDLLPVPKPTVAPVSATAVTAPTAQKAVVTPALDKAKVAAKPPVVKQPTPQLIRREKIAKELFDTERNYVVSLQVAIKYYLGPITDAVVKSEPIIPPEDIKVLFSIIEIIYKVNSEFFADLQARMVPFDPWTTCVGDLMEKFTERLKVYTRYINNYDKTMNVYANCIKAYPKFADFIYATREQPKVRGLDLLSYLIMPVQRIPRYILLLTDLLKQTPKDHPDHQFLDGALAKTKAIADYLNEAKRKAESVDKIELIYGALLNPMDIPDLVTTGRFFVRESTFVVRSGKESKYGYFFLLNDLILFCTQKKNNKFKLKQRIPLNEVSVSDEPDTNILKNAFRLGYTKDALILSASSDNEKRAWISDIKSYKR